MFNKRETALSVMVVAAVIVASFFAISFVTEASAQGNSTGGGASNSTAGGASMNKTGGASAGNMTGGNATK
jgi:hypothetical protein